MTTPSSISGPGLPDSGSGAPTPPVHRTVDLGREEELVTWNEWLARTMHAMRQIIPSEQHDRLAFRVTLDDTRQFMVRQVLTHVARGTCTIGPSRWNEREAVCDVITGYMFVGAGEDQNPSALGVSPASIASVECVLVPEQHDDEEPTPFGFYKRDGNEPLTEQKEVIETLVQSHWEGE